MMDDGHSVTEPADSDTSSRGRTPIWRRFDAEWYLAQYPEAASHMRDAGIDDPEAYYWSYGGKLGHAPNMFFDEAWYLGCNPDIAAHVAAGGARSGFEHYLLDGFHGRSPHWLFDEHRYRMLHPDLVFAEDASVGYVNGYDHFLDAGDAEGRSGHLFFDHSLYRRNVAESDAIRASPGGPFQHFLRDGAAAGSTARLSWYFDPLWYLQAYPEVAAALQEGRWGCALQHYLCNRTPERFCPSPWFSEEFYARTYPDAADAVVSGAFRNGYDHFVRFGAVERRQPHEGVDLARHFQSHAVQTEIERGRFRDAFAHWVATGGAHAVMDRPIVEAQSKALFARIADLTLTQFGRAGLDFTVEGQPTVSVILVMHNKFAFTMTALASLRRDYAGPIELVLVDSGSRDQSVGIERFVAGARLIRFADNVGFLAACNAGLERVTAPAVLFLNNDLTLGHAAVSRALARLDSSRGIGAVGAKCIRTNGLLQEAGSVITSDGWTAGYLRDADPDLPEANFVRDVDFCSGAFLMVRTDYLRALGGFDDDYRPAYYEETDLCVRLAKAGYRIVYDPQVVVHHVEFGSADARASERLIERNHGTFCDKHRDWLRHKTAPGQTSLLQARQTDSGKGRVLFIEDRIPMRDLGSGFVRSNDLIRCMAALGYQVGVYPVFPAVTSLFEVLRDFPDTVEIFYDRGMDELADFIAERAGFYDIVWIGRTHNLDRLAPILIEAGAALPEAGLVLDTEAVAAPRSIGQARLSGQTPACDLATMLRRELASAALCRQIVAVNDHDATLIREAGYDNVAILGHAQHPAPTATPFHARHGLLFVGAIHDPAGPNYDSLVWLIGDILPRLAALLPDVTLTIAGHVDPRVDTSPLLDPRVTLLGRVEDLAPLYDRHRVFVAPTRFAGGIPFKVHEAAAHGLPVVATDLLCRQVGWRDGCEILAGGENDPARFAERVAELYTSEALWTGLRDTALERIVSDHDPVRYRDQLGAILEAVQAQAGQDRA